MHPMSECRHVQLLHFYAILHTSELNCEVISEVQKVTVFQHPSHYPDLAPCDFSCIRNPKRSYLVVMINSNKPLAQPSVTVSEINLNQFIAMHFRNRFSRDSIYVFQTKIILLGDVMLILLYETNALDILYNEEFQQKRLKHLDEKNIVKIN